MRELRTTIDITAAPERVWEVLADFAAYGDWNPFIPRIAGAPVVGSRLDLEIQPPGGRRTRFRPVVTDATPERRFAWTGRLGVRGVFDGHHVFELAPTPDGGTRLVHAESFGGVLARPLLRRVGARTEAGFVAMNRALRDRVQATAATAA